MAIDHACAVRRQGHAGVVARTLDQGSYGCILCGVAEVDVVGTVHDDRHEQLGVGQWVERGNADSGVLVDVALGVLATDGSVLIGALGVGQRLTAATATIPATTAAAVTINAMGRLLPLVDVGDPEACAVAGGLRFSAVQALETAAARTRLSLSPGVLAGRFIRVRGSNFGTLRTDPRPWPRLGFEGSILDRPQRASSSTAVSAIAGESLTVPHGRAKPPEAGSDLGRWARDPRARMERFTRSASVES